MFKVTVSQADNTETWELEGKLSGEWVMELERCWKERKSPLDVPLEVRLKAISYIDAAGKQLLAQMHEAGVGIVGCGCMTKAVVEEISRSLNTN
jgi:ABC-type transporter Mla MlaB component